MARWLQQTVQGMLNAELKDLIPVHDAAFSKSGDPRYFWTEHVARRTTARSRHYRYDIGEPPLIHTEPNQQPNPRPSRRLHRAGAGTPERG